MIDAIELTFVVPDGNLGTPDDHKDALIKFAEERGLEIVLARAKRTDRGNLAWMVFELRSHTAVIPSYEDDHVIGLDCWCGPKIQKEDNWDVKLVTHRDLGERTGLGELTAVSEEI